MVVPPPVISTKAAVRRCRHRTKTPGSSVLEQEYSYHINDIVADCCDEIPEGSEGWGRSMVYEVWWKTNTDVESSVLAT